MSNDRPFTSAYRTPNNYGWMVLYGVVLSFVVYLVTELADRSGLAAVIDLPSAGWGPVFAASVIGLTLFFYHEGKRA
jgi:lipopolysaccharide export system permease protein